MEVVFQQKIYNYEHNKLAVKICTNLYQHLYVICFRKHGLTAMLTMLSSGYPTL